MPRTPRIERAQSYHHVTGRGPSDLVVFPTDQARDVYLQLLGDTARRLHWTIAAYAVLGTHHHELIWTPEQTLGTGMQRIHGRYAIWLNRRFARRGPVWGGRFHSRPVESLEHLARAVVYVDVNAVRAGLVARPQDWRWCSFSANAGLEAPHSWHDPLPARRAHGIDHGSDYSELVGGGIAPTSTVARPTPS